MFKKHLFFPLLMILTLAFTLIGNANASSEEISGMSWFFLPRENVYWTENVTTQGLLDLFDAASVSSTSRCVLLSEDVTDWDTLTADIVNRRNAECVSLSNASFDESNLYFLMVRMSGGNGENRVLASTNIDFLQDACEKMLHDPNYETKLKDDYWLVGIDPAE